MRKIFLLLTVLCVCSAGAFAQPTATGAVNGASYAAAGLPNGSLSQGGLIVIFGQGMGGSTPQELSFPLTTELDGVSVQVAVGGTAVDCIMIYALATQTACILPSITPVGAGTLTVTVNGQPSAPLDVDIVANSFGIFAINNAGSGPGVFTDPSFVVNTLVQAAHPGETWTIWGTGLGPVMGDEAAMPLPGNIPGLDVTVSVGGIDADVTYAGRSGCCAGIDQIAFVIPAGVTGCYVPVVVVVEGVPSNYTSMSIAESGNTCSESSGLLTSTNLEDAIADGSLRFGVIGLTRVTTSFTIPMAPSQSFESVTESAFADFWSYNFDQLLRTQSLVQISTIGACNVLQITGEGQEFEDPILPQELDAGPALTIVGPNGTRTLPKRDPGYFELFSSPTIPGLPLTEERGGADQLGGDSYLVAGDYTVSGPGGADVGAFTANMTLPPPLVWTNRDSIDTVTRSQGQRVTWTGGASNGFVQITGSSYNMDADENFYGAYFFCRAAASAGSFDIPSAVTLALPQSGSAEGVAFGQMSVGNTTDGNQFSADGIDLGIMTYIDITGKPVDYQ